jgi:hypothetical protein
MPRTTDTASSQAAVTDSELLAAAEQATATLAAVIEAGSAASRGFMLFALEMAEFSGAQLRQNLETAERLMGCTDPEQAFGIQCDSARAASRQFFSEAAKLLQLAADTTRESCASLEACAQRALERLKPGE